MFRGDLHSRPRRSPQATVPVDPDRLLLCGVSGQIGEESVMSGSPGTAIWLVIAAFVLTVPLVSFARRVGVSYPIVLVLAGLVLGFAPGLPPVQLDPDLVLLIFLPPLLFWESITAPTDVMRANARWITS